jgi:hypothetical protein
MWPRPVAGAARQIELARTKFYPDILWSGVLCSHPEVQEPRLPGEGFKIKTRYGGIHLESSPYYSAFMLFPFTFGQNTVGHIVEVGEKFLVELMLLWSSPGLLISNLVHPARRERGCERGLAICAATWSGG